MVIKHPKANQDIIDDLEFYCLNLGDNPNPEKFELAYSTVELDPDLNLDTCNFNWMTRKDTLNINMQLDLFVSYDTVIEKNGIRKLSRHSFTTSYITKVV